MYGNLNVRQEVNMPHNCSKSALRQENRSELFFSLWLFLLSLFSLFSFTALVAESDDTEYRVDLGSGSELHPTAVLFPATTGRFEQEHIQELISILACDMDMNGMMSVVGQKERDQIQKLVGGASGSFPILEMQKITPVSYLITSSVDGAMLSVSATSLVDGMTKKYSPVPLTNSMTIDRGRMHQLADFICKDLFDVEGVASTHILYSKRLTSVGTLKDKKQQITSSTSEIYLSDYDGANEKKSTALKTVSVTPQWIITDEAKTPSAFLFVSYLIGQPKIYIASTKDSKLVRLSKMRGNQFTPAVSPDGKKVVFCSDVLGSSDLYIMTFDQKIGEISKPRQIYKTPSCATGCPTFSPDGTKIAFVSNKDGSPKVYVMSIPSEMTKLKEIQTKLITKRCRENSAPSWSPDGTKIAYTAKQGVEERQIWIYDLAQDSEYKITQGPGNKENPTWAANSLHLAYQATDKGGKWDIYIMNLNQKKPMKITTGLGDNQFPAWGR